MSYFESIWHWTKAAGRPMAARLSRWSYLARRIMAESEALSRLDNGGLRRRSQDLRCLAKSGTASKAMLVEAYALVREAANRVAGKSHYEVQIMAGIGLFEGGLAEMQTGEGKTLTAALPAFLRALPGHGCHVVTANDYLAERDFKLMAPVFELLGLTVGCVLSSSDSVSRRVAYDRDITYATSREIGFDFLRDRLKLGSESRHAPRMIPGEVKPDGSVQRSLYFALVDEADSVLIDDTGTPLIIGLDREVTFATETLLAWSCELAKKLRITEDFFFGPEQRHVELTNLGTRRVLLTRKPLLVQSFDTEAIYTRVEHALRAQLAFHLGRDYVVTADQSIAIVDEGTGRTLEGHKWQEGLHQAVEAKEGVPITEETEIAARITVQSFFRRYQYLAGMTGTAESAAHEFRKTYGLVMTAIPPNRPCIRRGWSPRLFTTQAAKQATLIPEIERLIQCGRAILIGTPCIQASEALGHALSQRGLSCQILSGLSHEQEANTVAQAGQPGRITLTTNLAGRGTDIPLHDNVRSNGGLHVIATELHTNRRLDRQLISRAARQGDPGSYQFWLSLEDEMFHYLSATNRTALKAKTRPNGSGELSSGWLRVFRRVQRLVEMRDLKHRSQLLKREHTVATKSER